MKLNRFFKWTLRILAGLLGLVVLALLGVFLWARAQVSGSLPLLAGERTVDGLEAEVTIARDARGIPTIRAASRNDIAFATGFLHAQERFFQMDILRRQSAGEMAELLGGRLLGFDRGMRIHRFRSFAQQLARDSQDDERALVDAYAAGVNAGLEALEKPSFEYLVLQTEPQPWQAEDSYLILLTMFVLLHDERAEYESMLGLMHDTLTPEQFAFLTPVGTPEWDAPMTGEPFAAPTLPGTWPQGGVEDGGTSGEAEGENAAAPETAGSTTTGASSAWAVTGASTSHGGAMLALDMHLPLTVPNIWYRAAFAWGSGDGSGEHFVTGVTLPGAPLLVAGSNARVAWGFTNSRIDTTDVVLTETDPEDEGSYLTPEGPRPFLRHQEVLRTKEGEEESLEVVWTHWGPLLPEDHKGHRRALRWVAHEAEAVDFKLLRIETAAGVEEALAVVQTSGIPAQNFVVADADGHIGWTVAGRIPRRVGCGGEPAPGNLAAPLGCDGRLPSSWAAGTHGWDGLLDPSEVPRIVDPPSGRIWTANNRVVGGEELALLGDGNYILGARARQIRDGLAALGQATEEDMLRIQLDDRALFLERWRALLLEEVLSEEALGADEGRREFRRLVEDWGGRATVDSAGYRLVRDFREELAQEVFAALTAPCREVDPELDYYDEAGQAEAPLWQLVSRRPPQAHDRRHAGWDEQLLAAVDAVIAGEPPEEGAEPLPLSERTLGEANQASIRHLFSRAVPILSGWLDMPAEPLPGDVYMPRVQRPSYGASQRMVVSPGHEDEAIFHMPGGQSGHPMSPHYRDSHAAWVAGEPTPLLPGESVNTLVLKPGA